MMAINAEWKRRANMLFAPLRDMDSSWLPTSLRRNAELLDLAMVSHAARKLIYKSLPKDDSPADDIGDDVPAWGERHPALQRELVLRLGALGCSTEIRRTIEKDDIVAVRNAIDDESYRAALARDVPLIEDDVRGEYRNALEADDLRRFIGAIGLSVLTSACPGHETVVRLRLRFLFPAKAWETRRAVRLADREHVIELIDGFSGD